MGRTRTSTSARKRTPEKWNQDKTSIVVVHGKACVILQAAVRGNFHRAWTKSSERSRTRKSWNQEKTSIALVARHVDFRLQRPLARARGVWRTRTWSRNRTTSLRSWNRTRTRLSDRTRTRTSCNQDKTSIAASTSAPPCRRCTRSSWWCRSCPKCRRGKRSVGVEDQGMDQEQDAVVSPPGFAYSDLNRIMT